MSWALHSFCGECGAHRREMPFGEESEFFDKGVCPKCAAPARKRKYAVARRKLFGGWERK